MNDNQLQVQYTGQLDNLEALSSPKKWSLNSVSKCSEGKGKQQPLSASEKD